MSCAMIILIIIWYLLVLFANFSVKRLNFVTIATVKVKLIRDLYTLAIVLINYQEEIGGIFFYILAS